MKIATLSHSKGEKESGSCHPKSGFNPMNQWPLQAKDLEELFEKQLLQQLENLPPLDMAGSLLLNMDLLEYQQQGMHWMVQLKMNYNYHFISKILSKVLVSCGIVSLPSCSKLLPMASDWAKPFQNSCSLLFWEQI
ncbi:hypothetical protein ACA910_019593 [Epithemia clementina (nom. ined.)]